MILCIREKNVLDGQFTSGVRIRDNFEGVGQATVLQRCELWLQLLCSTYLDRLLEQPFCEGRLFDGTHLL